MIALRLGRRAIAPHHTPAGPAGLLARVTPFESPTTQLHRRCGRPLAGCYFSPALLEPAFKEPQLSGYLCEARLRHFLVRCNCVLCTPIRPYVLAHKHRTVTGHYFSATPLRPLSSASPLPSKQGFGGVRIEDDVVVTANGACSCTACNPGLTAVYDACPMAVACGFRSLPTCCPHPQLLPAGAETLCDVPRTVEEIEAVMAGGPWPPAGKQQ